VQPFGVDDRDSKEEKNPEANARRTTKDDPFGGFLTEIPNKVAQDRLFEEPDLLEELAIILSRRNHARAVILGSHETGKASLVNALACLIASGQVPEGLRNQRLSVEASRKKGFFLFVSHFSLMVHRLVLDESGPKQVHMAKELLYHFFSKFHRCIIASVPNILDENLAPSGSIALGFQVIGMDYPRQAKAS